MLVHRLYRHVNSPELCCIIMASGLHSTFAKVIPVRRVKVGDEENRRAKIATLSTVGASEFFCQRTSANPFLVFWNQA